MTKQKHLKRHIRERMKKTGEAYTTARLHLLATVPAVPEGVLPARGQAPQVSLRVRRPSRRASRPGGLRYVAPAFVIVISLVISGIITLAPAPSQDGSSLPIAEVQP